MELGSLKKIAGGPAADLCAGLPIEERLAELIADDRDARALLAELVAARRYLGALRFLVCCLPDRETVWVGCLAARSLAERVPLADADAAALEAVEQWVYQPSDDKRRAAHALSERTGYATPGALAALAAFYSGGSIGAVNLPDTPPPAGVCARLVEGAVIMATADDDPDTVGGHARRLLTQCLDVAAGGSGRNTES